MNDCLPKWRRLSFVELAVGSNPIMVTEAIDEKKTGSHITHATFLIRAAAMSSTKLKIERAKQSVVLLPLSVCCLQGIAWSFKYSLTKCLECYRRLITRAAFIMRLNE